MKKFDSIIGVTGSIAKDTEKLILDCGEFWTAYIQPLPVGRERKHTIREIFRYKDTAGDRLC